VSLCLHFPPPSKPNFDTLWPDDAMEAIEDLLKVINLDGKRLSPLRNGGKGCSHHGLKESY
jgi:hypothetical protein